MLRRASMVSPDGPNVPPNVRSHDEPKAVVATTRPARVPAQAGVFFSAAPMKALRKSTGTGKMVVELFSLAISVSVCR